MIQSNYYIKICISKRVRTISTQYLVLSHYYSRSGKSDKQKYLTASFINVFLFRNISRDFNADTEIHPLFFSTEGNRITEDCLWLKRIIFNSIQGFLFFVKLLKTKKWD